MRNATTSKAVKIAKAMKDVREVATRIEVSISGPAMVPAFTYTVMETTSAVALVVARALVNVTATAMVMDKGNKAKVAAGTKPVTAAESAMKTAMESLRAKEMAKADKCVT
jgi:hypothetical protein